MADQKKDPRSGELIFRTDMNRREATRYRYWRQVQDQQKKAKKTAKESAKKRAAAAVQGTEGPKKSKPGGYSALYLTQSAKKKRKV